MHRLDRLELAHAGAQGSDQPLDRLGTGDGGKFELGDLLDFIERPEPGRTLHQDGIGIDHRAGGPGNGAEGIGEVGRGFEPGFGRRCLGGTKILPAGDADALPGGEAGGAQQGVERRRLAAILAHQAEGRVEDGLNLDRGRGGAAEVFGPGEQGRRGAGDDDEERFLEARVEAGEVSEVGAMLAVGIDQRRVKAGVDQRPGEGAETAGIDLVRQLRLLIGYAEIGELRFNQTDGGHDGLLGWRRSDVALRRRVAQP